MSGVGRISQGKRKEQEMAKRRSRKKTIGLEILDFSITVTVIVTLVFLANRFFLINARIPTASMENTILSGDRIFGNRLAYRERDPKRYDVVIFYYPDDPQEKTLYIKRVIGLPGETVSIRAGKVYINGGSEPLDDSFCPEPPEGDYGPYVVPEDSYFLLGDNRNDSFDARFWNNKYITKDKILGEAVLRYWPLTRIGMVS